MVAAWVALVDPEVKSAKAVVQAVEVVEASEVATVVVGKVEARVVVRAADDAAARVAELVVLAATRASVVTEVVEERGVAKAAVALEVANIFRRRSPSNFESWAPRSRCVLFL
jgi:hypothetical protein